MVNDSSPNADAISSVNSQSKNTFEIGLGSQLLVSTRPFYHFRLHPSIYCTSNCYIILFILYPVEDPRR